MGVDVDDGLDFSEDKSTMSPPRKTLPMSATLPSGSSPHWGISG